MHLIQSVTSFTRTPAEGRWKDGRKTEHDDIAVIEVMTETIEHEWWSDFRRHLEQQFNQDEVVIRCQPIQTPLEAAALADDTSRWLRPSAPVTSASRLRPIDHLQTMA